MKRKILVCMGLVFVLISCTISQTQKGREIVLTPIDSLCSVIGLPTIMELFDGKLFLVDMFNGDSLISVFDIKTNKKILSFGKKGNGPEEFLHISNIDFKRNIENQIELLVFDPIRQKCFSYNYEELFNDGVLKGVSFKMDTSVPNLFELYKLESGYIATGKIEGNKYLRLSDSLKIIDFFGNYRPKPIDAIPDVLHRQANYGKTELSLDKKKMVEIVYSASVLSLYDIEKDGITKKWEYLLDELDYDVVDGSVVNKSVVGYISAHAGRNNIYALFSGEAENLDEIAAYGNEIHVFDYDGKLVDKIKLERSAFLLSVDEEEGKLFALCHVPETVVLVYNYKP